MTIVRCPNCEATYNLDPAKLENGGRKLKCARCQTVWVATAEPVAAALAVAEPVVEPVAAEAPVPVDGPDAAPSGEDVPPELIQRTPHVEAMVRVGSWQQWLRGGTIWRTGAMGLLALGLLAGAGTVLWRTQAAKPHKEEKLEKVLTDTSAKPNHMVEPPAGVVLHRVRGEVTPVAGENGGVALTVRGLLANTTSATVAVPALQLELLGADGKVADLWPVSGVSGTLPPEAEQAWTVSLTAPDMSSIKGWRIVFVK